MPEETPAKPDKPQKKPNGHALDCTCGRFGCPKPEIPTTPIVTMAEAKALIDKVEAEAPGVKSDLGPELEKLALENAELRRQNEALNRGNIREDIKAGEVDALLRRARKQVAHQIQRLASVADVLRSTSINNHSTEHHGGNYEHCQHPLCFPATQLWEELGGIEGVQLAIKDPQAWLDRADFADEDTDEEEPEVVHVEDLEAIGTPVGVVTSGSIEVDPADMGWDPKYAGKTTGRVLHVKDPEIDRDKDDPGPLDRLRIGG